VHHPFDKVIAKKKINLQVVNTFFALSIASYYVGMHYMPQRVYWPRTAATTEFGTASYAGIYSLDVKLPCVTRTVVIPAKAGIHSHYLGLNNLFVDPRLRGDDTAWYRNKVSSCLKDITSEGGKTYVFGANRSLQNSLSPTLGTPISSDALRDNAFIPLLSAPSLSQSIEAQTAAPLIQKMSQMNLEPPENGAPSLFSEPHVKTNSTVMEDIVKEQVIVAESVKHSGFVRAMGDVKVGDSGSSVAVPQDSLLPYEAYKQMVTSSANRIWVNFWLWNATKNATQEEIPFRRALINVILSDHFQPYINLDWEEGDSEEAQKRRNNFFHAFLDNIEWSKTHFTRKHSKVGPEDNHAEALAYYANTDAYDYAYEFPQKLGIRAYSYEDIKCDRTGDFGAF
jgi:hypothetical protein